MLKFLGMDRNDALHDALNAIRHGGQAVCYNISTADSTREFDDSPIGSALSPSADEYPDVAAASRSIFRGAGGLFAAHGVTPAVSTSGTTVVVKDARDEEKEVTAHQGQARMSLFNIGGKIDVDAGKVIDLTYGTPFTIIEGINAMPRASRAGQFAQASTQRNRRTARNDHGVLRIRAAAATCVGRGRCLAPGTAPGGKVVSDRGSCRRRRMATPTWARAAAGQR